MPRLIETLKKKALDRAVANGHNMGKFQRVQGGEEVHVASCKDCGAEVEIVDSGIGGSACTEVCSTVPEREELPTVHDRYVDSGRINPECGVPLNIPEAMEVIAMKTEPIKEGDGVMFGTVTAQEIAEHGGSLLAEDYIGEAGKSKRPKLHFHYMQHRKYAKLLVAFDMPKREGAPVPKERPRYGTLPDGTTYDMRTSGWVRTTSRKCEDKEYDFHNNSTRRRLA